jgi:hypothetical protein
MKSMLKNLRYVLGIYVYICRNKTYTKGGVYMKKALVCLVLSLTLILSTTVAVFAVDDVGLSIKPGDTVIVKPLVDDVGL